MTTRVLTTNPDGHTVSLFEDNKTVDQVAEIYMQFYDSVKVIRTDYTIPNLDYLECRGQKIKVSITKEPHIYRVKTE